MSGVRSEESCETQCRVRVVPVVVEPVPVQHHLPVVLDEVRDVLVAVAVQHVCTECRLCHCPLNTQMGCIGFAIYNRLTLCTKYLHF